jgi:hypothetical protein
VKRVKVIVAQLLAAYGVFGVPSLPSFSVRTQPATVVKEPSEAMKSTVKPVIRVVSKMSPIDRLWLQTIYSNAAKVVAADGVVEPQVIVTTEGLRAIHVAILKFIWRGMAGNPPGEYEGLSEAVDSAIAEVISDKQRPLTPELRAKAVEVFDAIAWAGLGKDQ